MPNPSSISSFKRREPMLAIAIFIALVVILETVFALMPQNKLVKSFQADAFPAKSPDWQVMGDSVAAGGIVGSEVEKFLPSNVSVHNAAMAGTGPEFSYFVLKRQLAAGRAPKAILYAPSPHTFASGRVSLLVGGYCKWSELPDVARTRSEPFEQVYGVLCKLSYTLRYREQLGDWIKGRRADDEDGGAKPSKAGGPVKHYTVATIHLMYKKPFEVRGFNGAMFEKFLSLAEENHIPVYWATMPVMPAVHEGREPSGFDGEYYRFLDGLKAEHGVQLLVREFPVWADEKFKDMTHLNTEGAEEFSKLVGEKLAGLSSAEAAGPLR